MKLAQCIAVVLGLSSPLVALADSVWWKINGVHDSSMEENNASSTAPYTPINIDLGDRLLFGNVACKSTGLMRSVRPQASVWLRSEEAQETILVN